MPLNRAIGLVLLALSPAAAVAQVTTGTLSGSVTDELGGALPGATISIRAIETGAVRSLTTDAEGRYSAPALEPGPYEISVELQGFQTLRRADLRLSVGQHLALDAKLTVGRIEDVVTVTAESPAIDTSRSAV